MSADWNTKYGTRRVRHDPPTLDEAIFAAVGMTDDHEQQAEIAAALMGMPIEIVQAEVKKQARTNGRITATRVIAGEQGAQRSVVVERRVVRRFGNDKAHRYLSAQFPIPNTKADRFCRSAFLIPVRVGI
ncbi:hypothetical protein ACVW0J_006595 [Bradyrhizobium sp. i1.7.7]